MNEENIYR